MKTQKELIYERIITLSKKTDSSPLYFTTKEIADYFTIQRSNASSLLNELTREGLLDKTSSRPVKYCITKENKNIVQNESFRNVIGVSSSLKNQVQLAKASLLYPDQILSTLLVGEKGTGKDFFAYTMYEFANEMNLLDKSSEYIMINCHDYKDIDQLNNYVFVGSDSLVQRIKQKMMSSYILKTLMLMI